MIRQQRGFTAIELVTVAAIIGVAMAMSAPSLIRANQNYRIGSAAQQITQALQGTRYEAIRRNAVNTAVFDKSANTITLYATTVNASTGATTVRSTVMGLPEGVFLEDLPSTIAAPSIVQSAFSSRSSFADTDYKNLSSALSATSMPLDSTGSTTAFRATFTSRGLPATKAGAMADPGTVHWFYLRNVNNERRAVTLTSTGSTQVWRYTGSAWIAVST